MNKKRVFDKTKLSQKRGTGRYEKYKPWIEANEISSEGTTATLNDWKHGRRIETLSDGEYMYYYILRWNDEVDDINEQYPLPLETTMAIAEKLGYPHPSTYGNKEPIHMTSDFLVWMKDGSRRVYSVKSDRTSTHIERCSNEIQKRKVPGTLRKLAIERYYWEKYVIDDNGKNVVWKLIYSEDVDVKYADNIRHVVEYYDINSVHDKQSIVKHLIATKSIKVEMRGVDLDYDKIADEYPEEVKWIATRMNVVI